MIWIFTVFNEHLLYDVLLAIYQLSWTLTLPFIIDAASALASGERGQLYALMTEDRARYGKGALVLDAELCALAQEKAEDMRDNNYCGHNSPRLGNARQLLTSRGVRFKGVGENVARSRDVAHSHAAFLSSWGHRINELSSSWTHVGIGVAVTRSGFVYVCEIFVRR